MQQAPRGMIIGSHSSDSSYFLPHETVIPVGAMTTQYVPAAASNWSVAGAQGDEVLTNVEM